MEYSQARLRELALYDVLEPSEWYVSYLFSLKMLEPLGTRPLMLWSIQAGDVEYGDILKMKESDVAQARRRSCCRIRGLECIT